MVFAIVRVAVISSHSYEPDQSWLYLWSSIEQTISVLPHAIHYSPHESNTLILYLAIMVACLASFRALFVKQNTSAHRGNAPYPTGSGSRRGLLGTKGLKSFFSTKERLPDHDPSKQDSFGTKGTHTTHTRATRPSESDEPIISLHDIHLRREFEAISYPRAVEA